MRPVVAQEHKRVTVPMKLNIYYFHFFALAPRQSAALSSATQQAMPPEFGGKRRADWINTKLSLPSVKTLPLYLIQHEAVVQ